LIGTERLHPISIFHFLLVGIYFWENFIMTLLKQVLKRDVRPALGCTEPIAVAYASAVAMSYARKKTNEVYIKKLKVTVDPGVFKNGMGVTIPNSFGQKGNVVAAALGALSGKPELELEVLKDTTREDVDEALELIDDERVHLHCNNIKSELYIGVQLKTRECLVEVVTEKYHTNLVKVCVDGELQELPGGQEKANESSEARLCEDTMKNATVQELVDEVERADSEDLDYLRQGVEMNMEVARAGKELNYLGGTLLEMEKEGLLTSDVFTDAELITACATDARMNGCPLPVMSSGGSGNQGIVAILVPYMVGKAKKVDEVVMLRSLALSHLINAKVKCYTGELSPLCGCAIAGGLGAAVAIAYQLQGNNMEVIGKAINNISGDLTGMLCDGAKGGCSLKVASSARAAIKAAFVAERGLSLETHEGIVGHSPEETIRNIGLVGTKGMLLVNDTCVSIMTSE
jgi:L-cysteine desulfidase